MGDCEGMNGLSSYSVVLITRRFCLYRFGRLSFQPIDRGGVKGSRVLCETASSVVNKALQGRCLEQLFFKGAVLSRRSGGTR